MKEKERLNNMQRRKFIKTTASAAIISTVASAPVLGREFCTVSGSMSGNMSNANINANGAITPDGLAHFGTNELKGNSIPEPAPLGLLMLGLGLIGASRFIKASK